MRQTHGEATAAGMRGELSELQAGLLRVYRATGGASRKTLAAMLGVKPQSLSGALIKLQALGLIPRERLPYPRYQKR